MVYVARYLARNKEKIINFKESLLHLWLPVAVILAFILLYRFGEAMLLKVASLFLLDKPELGGLGLSTQEFGRCGFTSFSK